jgi:hypothetical protein
MGAQGLDRKRPLHVAQALAARQAALRRRVARAQQQAGVGPPRCQVLRQQGAWLKPRSCRRSRDSGMGSTRSAAPAPYPGRAAQQRGQRRPPSRV